MKSYVFEIKCVYAAKGDKNTREKILILEKEMKNKTKNMKEIREDIKKYFDNAILTEYFLVASLSNILKFIINRQDYEIILTFLVSDNEILNIKAKVYYNSSKKG